MILLVTDTSGRNGSVALARVGEGSSPDNVEVIEEAPLTGGTFSAQLVPQIAALLARDGLNKSDISAFVVVSGPGSFTGLRIGLAAVKGLAEILRKPIVPVSLLEVMACSAFSAAVPAGSAPQVCPYAVALGAGRGEAFVGQFEVVLEGKTINAFRATGESVLDLEALANLIDTGAAQWIATPDAEVADFLAARHPDRAKHSIVKQAGRPSILEIAEIGWGKLQAGESASPGELEANYLRRSDAEIFGKPSS
jgi:tRNA threonylcarbamoyladenosine biosynthesis protein TsaB